MTTEPTITGRLENWRWSSTYRDSIEGNVYDDSKRRFGDGTYIYTSTVVKEVTCPITHRRFAYTLNSIYELGEKYVKGN